MRITILGMPGSGKSTLARLIAKKEGVTHINLDQFWSEGGGGHNSKTTPDPERTQEYVKEKTLEAIQAESWVSDGVYSLVQNEIAGRADSIIYLDIPLWQRLVNHVNRLLNRRERHDQMTLWADIEFCMEMLKPDPKKVRNIEGFLERYQDKTIILKTRKDIARYVEAL